MLHLGTGHPKSFSTPASLGERNHYLPILSLLCHLCDQPLNNTCIETLNFSSTAFHCIFINKHVTILTADCQILSWKDFSTPSIVHPPAKGYRLVAHTEVNGPPQQEALLESFSPVSQDATKHMTEPTGLTWTLLLPQALNNLHPKLPLTAVSHIPVIPVVAPHIWLLNVSVSAHSSASRSTPALGKAFTLLLPLQNLSSYRRAGTGKPGKSYSISPLFPAEDAIAHT